MIDKHGNEWAWVPARLTKEMIAGAMSAWAREHEDFADLYAAAIAAAPQFEAVEVTDEVCERICDAWYASFGRRRASDSGRDMIAAVRAELGPTLGLVTREELAARVEAAYLEAHSDGSDPDDSWERSNARKQLEPKVGGES